MLTKENNIDNYTAFTLEAGHGTARQPEKNCSINRQSSELYHVLCHARPHHQGGQARYCTVPADQCKHMQAKYTEISNDLWVKEKCLLGVNEITHHITLGVIAWCKKSLKGVRRIKMCLRL